MDDSKAARKSGRHAAASEHPEEPSSPWEWAVAALGLFLILGAIGYMAYYGLTLGSRPPMISIVQESIEPAGNEFLVMVTVANRGDATVASLTIEGELHQGGALVETSEVTIDYVPRQSERKAGLYFNRNPAQYRLELRPTGFTTP